jgi:hypothetical protein
LTVLLLRKQSNAKKNIASIYAVLDRKSADGSRARSPEEALIAFQRGQIFLMLI